MAAPQTLPTPPTPADKRALRKALKDAGAFERHSATTWARFLTLLAVAGAMIAAAIVGPAWLGWVLFTPVGCLVAVAAMYGHEGVHRSHSSSDLSNTALGTVAFPLLSGLGRLYWRFKHDGGHHGHPNVYTGDPAGSDPDLDLWPMALTKADHEASPAWRKFLQKHLQRHIFWPLTHFMVWSMRVTTFQFMAKRIRQKGVDREVMLELAALVGHYTLWLAVPTVVFGLGFWPVFGFYYGVWAVASVVLSAVFLPAHVGLELTDEVSDAWLLQFDNTQNLKVPFGLGWAFVGLHHQIEHHIFPRIPHGRMHIAAPIVQAFALKHGLPYRTVGWFQGLRDATRFIGDGWTYEPTPQIDRRATLALETPQAPLERAA